MSGIGTYQGTSKHAYQLIRLLANVTHTQTKTGRVPHTIYRQIRDKNSKSSVRTTLVVNGEVRIGEGE